MGILLQGLRMMAIYMAVGVAVNVAVGGDGRRHVEVSQMSRGCASVQLTSCRRLQ